MFDFIGSKLFWITAVFIIIYVYLKYYVYNYWKRHGVPHETASIPFGNVPVPYFFGKIPLGILFKKSYEKFKCQRFHGFYIFSRPVIVINDPELIRTVLVKEFSRFCNRGWFFDENVDPMSNNLFLQNEDKWKRMRAKFTPTFTPGKLRQFYPLIMEISSEMIKTCDAELKKGALLEIKDIIARYTTDIISSVVYGFNCNSLKNSNSEFRRYGMRAFEFGSTILLVAIFLPEIIESVVLPFFYPQGVRKFFTRILEETMNHRRKEGIVRKDFLDLLMQLVDSGTVEEDKKIPTIEQNIGKVDRISMNDAVAQAFVFFLGGFETSSSTATFCLLELALNPDIQDKLRQEIDEVAGSSTGLTFDRVMEMEYLDMVFAETLRKYSSLHFLNRVCTEDFPIPDSNYTIPKGMRVLISSPGIQNNPEFYPDPDKFDPSRFSKENIASRRSYTYLGFGEGPRNCIGQRFGILQTKQAVVTILHNYNIYISEKTNLPLKFATDSVIFTPEGGIYLRFEKR